MIAVAATQQKMFQARVPMDGWPELGHALLVPGSRTGSSNSGFPAEAGKGDFGIRAARWISSHGFEARPYQVHAARLALRQLAIGNVILQLPQGTGKTLVTQLIIYELLRLQADLKILVVTPTLELRNQYFRLGKWMRDRRLEPRLQMLNLDESFHHRVDLHLRRSDVVVTTPRSLANRLSRMPAAVKWRPDLCVLDEVDLWSVADSDDDEERLHLDVAALLAQLPASIKVLGMTASPLTDEAREFLANRLQFKEIKPTHPSMKPYLPRVRIWPVQCLDSEVMMRDAALETEFTQCLGMLKARGVELALGSERLVAQLRRLAAISSELGISAGRAIALIQQRTALYEDSSISKPSAKTRAAIKILCARTPSILMAREARVLERFCGFAALDGDSVVHAEIPDYLARIERFRRVAGTMLLTRALGKRGLDFPEVETLVIYSPMWSWRALDQELCRTRGQRRSRPLKVVHILYYGGTGEERKLKAVLKELLSVSSFDGLAKYEVARLLASPQAGVSHRQRLRDQRRGV